MFFRRADFLAVGGCDPTLLVMEEADFVHPLPPARPEPASSTAADTGTRTGRLMLAELGGLADVERDLIRTRTAEGRSRAKAQGKAMGRRPALRPAQQKDASRRRAQGATLQELADSYDVGISTIRRSTTRRMSSTATARRTSGARRLSPRTRQYSS
ncbi:MAG: recombinase family protein [Stellaceae bacterium]